MAIIMNILVRLMGQSSRNGAKPLIYACLAPQAELEGVLCTDVHLVSSMPRLRDLVAPHILGGGLDHLACILHHLVRLPGQTSCDGAKPHLYACLAPHAELEGVLWT